jgi:hypothetical protein
MTTTLYPAARDGNSFRGFIDHAKDSEMPRWEGALDRLISVLLRAFFIAMAVTGIVMTIAAVFR